MYFLPKLKNDLKKFLKELPAEPGVYKFIDQNNLPIYIGKAKNIKKRVIQYFQESKSRTKKMENLIIEAKYLELTLTNDELGALLLEQHLIKEFRPKFNIQFKDDKGYPWLKIGVSKKFPRINSFLGKKDNIEEYYGPYPSSYAAKEALSLIQKTFKLRDCTDSYFNNRSRPCMQYEIGRCSAPCVGLVDQKEYMAEVKSAQRLLEGKGESLVEEFYALMDGNSNNKSYERAAVYRDKISALRDIQRNQSITGYKKARDAITIHYANGITRIGITHVKEGWIVSHKNYIQENIGLSESVLENFIKSHYLSDINCPPCIILNQDISDKLAIQKAISKYHNKSVKIITKPTKKDRGLIEIASSNTKQSLKRALKNKKDLSKTLFLLKEALLLEKVVRRIESYDISHHSGAGAVGSCVVYTSVGKLLKDYRLFNISNKNRANDVASMVEVIERRFKESSLNLDKPSHILIDGGKPHIDAVSRTLKNLNLKDIELISISKGARRKAELDSIHKINSKVLRVVQGSVSHLFLQEIRDETHRFAITNQRKKQLKLSLNSSLDEAFGIGSIKKKLLLRYFGSMEQIQRASLQDLVSVPMIGPKTAKLIYNYLH